MTQEAWVTSQTRAMTGWVNSKVSLEVEDLKTRLGDGLVLIELINSIVSETNPSLGVLTPVYKKPNFALQKMENIDDALQYCRLVLQINTCNISAEDIVGGNLKLILGLIWTLFVFATSSLLSLSSESKSFSQIKAILLQWLNERRKHHALSEIVNFNVDWSLQKDKRPDLMFASIITYYSPGSIDYRELTQRNPLANLQHIISFANSHFGIQDLAIADDFNVLVPDEKSVLLYVLQWYMYFVIEPQEIDGCDSLDSAQYDVHESQDGSFISVVLKANKLKNQYDTKSLRLLNQVNSNMNRFRLVNETLNKREPFVYLASQLKDFCAELDGQDLTEQVNRRPKFEDFRNYLGCIANALKIYNDFITRVQPLIVRDLPDLKRTYKKLNCELESSGLDCNYQPLKLLQLEALLAKCGELISLENSFKSSIQETVACLSDTNMKNIDGLLQNVADSKDVPRDFMMGLEAIESFNRSFEVLREPLMLSTSDLRLVISGKEEDSISRKATEMYSHFRNRVSESKNQRNLTYSDVKKFLKQIMLPSEFNGLELHEIIRLIPARTILIRSESETFSDDSSFSNDGVLFEEALKSLEHKLSGNYNKLYDLTSFVGRLESGFAI